MRVWCRGQAIELTAQDYVGAGGEGTIYARGGTAYKVYHEPSRVLPAGKLQELSLVADARVIRPETLLTDRDGNPVGYASRFVRDAWALCQLFPRAFRDRNGLTHEQMARLVERLRDGVEAVHRAGVLIVDLNEMNFLVTPRFDEVLFIDADSWQTPHYPATAVMPSVRDWSAQVFSEGSDWFSFGVVSFQMFTGIHPYKGRHPRVAGLEARMKAGLSVFDGEVRLPAAAYPLDVIPPAWRAWYREVFAGARRCAPPSAAAGGPRVVVPAVRRAAGSGLFAIDLLREYDGPVAGFWLRPADGLVVVATDAGVWLGERRVGPVPAGVRGCGFAPSGTPVLVAWQGGVPRLLDLERQQEVPLEIEAQEVACAGGRIYARCGEVVHEVLLHESGGRTIATLAEAARVLEHATRLHPGVVLQTLLGSTYASLLVASGRAWQVRLEELDGRRVVDARFERGVLAAVAERRGRYDRLVLRFDPADGTHDVRVVEDVGPSALNMAVLDTGVCACLVEDDRLEVFSARKGSAALRVLEDPALGGDVTLGGLGGVIVSRGAALLRVGTRAGA